MKIRSIAIILLAAFLAACAAPTTPPRTPTATAIPTATFIPPSATPTLPPTLTPLPALLPQPTPTALYSPQKLSEADQAVYEQALKDILLYRQGDIHITVQDENGKPLSGYKVQYRQTSHDFLFGGISDNFFYTDMLKQAGLNAWSVYTAWNWTEPELGKFDLDFANYWLGIDELHNGGMTVRAQGLYWFSPVSSPPYYRDVSYDEFLKRLSAHVATTVTRFAPAVDYWEAVLEPDAVKNNPLGLTKDEYYQAIATAIEAIRANDPTAQVEINLGIPCGGFNWLDSYRTLQEMLAREIDFDLVGLQLYYNAYIADGNYPMPKMTFGELSACYDKYEKLLTPYGKKIVDTEFTVPSEAPAGQNGYWNIPWSEETQAQYLTTAYTLFFAKPSNMGFVWWNTVEPSGFVYQGGLIRDDGTPKKSFYALQNLIESWTTVGAAITDPDGNIAFKGFGGDYELVISDPVTGTSMSAQTHILEQKANSQIIQFTPNPWLDEQKHQVEQLVAYWETQAETARVQKGQAYLALIAHHQQNNEWDLARQTLSAALGDLSITTEMVIPNERLLPVGARGEGFTMENGSQLIWGSTTLHFPYDFPAGKVTVEIIAHSHNEKGEAPIMVSGISANYSPVWQVENEQSQVYTFTVTTTGNEQDLTIRFPYDKRSNARITAQGGNVGELKLYIDQVKMIITTTEIPK